MAFPLQFFGNLSKLVLSWKFLLKLFVYCPLIIVLTFLAVWLYLSTETISSLVSLDEAQKNAYDYIIVGGGTGNVIDCNSKNSH